MIYFDNAATGGRKPSGVLSAVRASLVQCANAGRSGHRLSVHCAETIQKTREELCDFFGGYSFDRTVFTKNCTEALNIAIFSALREGGHAVLSCMEHNSVLRPLERLRREGKAEYSVVPLQDGKITPEGVLACLRPNTRAVVMTTASNVNGFMPDLPAIRRVLPPNVLFILDGAQGAGHIPLDMRSLGADALALAGHKGLYAIQGSGALLFSERFQPEPILFGGTGSESFDAGMPDFYPDRLESGTLNFPAIASLYEGVVYAKLKLEETQKKLTALTALLIGELKKIPRIRVYSQANPCGIVAFLHEDLPSEEIATLLSEKYSVAVRGGLHCSPLAHRALGTAENGLVRASLSPFNTREEIAVLLSALKRG